MSASTQPFEAAAPAKHRRRAPGPQQRRRGQIPWWWIVPGLLVVIALQYVPVVAGSWYALTDYDGFSSPKFVGLDNFTRLAHDSVAKSSIWHTLELAVVFVIAVNLLGLGFALAINRLLKTRPLVRAMLFLPVVLTPLATSYIWGFIFQTDGPLNALLGSVGLE